MYTTFFRVWVRSLLTYQDLPMVHMCDLMAPDYLAYQIFTRRGFCRPQQASHLRLLLSPGNM